MQKFLVSRDDQFYLAWPDLTLTTSGRLICVFSECTHHGDRSYTRIMLCDTDDRGRTWSPRRPLTVAARKPEAYWNCARISTLPDGRLAVVVDRIAHDENNHRPGTLSIHLFFSSDEGRTWTEPIQTPAAGIVPDKLQELSSGRWILSCHRKDAEIGYLVQRLWYSDDRGTTWHGPVVVARQSGLHLCEASILQAAPATLVAFMRENSFQGWDCFKATSEDDGLTWSLPVRFPLPGCHRPVAGLLRDGRVLITYRFLQGGVHGFGTFMQNFFAALTDVESALSATRDQARTRIFPVDFDRSPRADLGYSGWVQFDDGEIYIVNYIVDDAPKAQIRGYSLRLSDMLLA